MSAEDQSNDFWKKHKYMARSFECLQQLVPHFDWRPDHCSNPIWQFIGVPAGMAGASLDDVPVGVLVRHDLRVMRWGGWLNNGKKDESVEGDVLLERAACLRDMIAEWGEHAAKEARTWTEAAASVCSLEGS